MADEKAEEIIQKIRKLQKLVRSYDEAPQKKHKQSPKKSRTPKKEQNSKKFSEIEIPDELFSIGSSLLSRGKKVRHIHNQKSTRHFLDLWISSLLKRLMEKQKINGIQDDNPEKNLNKVEFNTDELINDPGVKEVEKEVEKIVRDLDL